MHLSGGPSDVLITLKKRDERIVKILFTRPGRQTDLHGGIGATFGSACRLEVNGSEDGVPNLDKWEIAKGWGNGNWKCSYGRLVLFSVTFLIFPSGR